MCATKKSTKMNDAPPRKSGRPSIVKDLREGEDLDKDEWPVTQHGSATTNGVGAENSGRHQRAKRVNYQE